MIDSWALPTIGQMSVWAGVLWLCHLYSETASSVWFYDIWLDLCTIGGSGDMSIDVYLVGRQACVHSRPGWTNQCLRCVPNHILQYWINTKYFKCMKCVHTERYVRMQCTPCAYKQIFLQFAIKVVEEGDVMVKKKKCHHFWSVQNGSVQFADNTTHLETSAPHIKCTALNCTAF